MTVDLALSGLPPDMRLDIQRQANAWSLLDGKTVLASGIQFPDKDLGLDHYKCIVNQDGASVRIIRFADLHRHSDCSLRDGMTRIPDMVRRTEYAGALTDHGNLYGFLEFYKTMKAANKHPIIGIEAYQEDLQGKLEGNHLILLAKNMNGYKNLLKLTSESFDHFYRKPHVTWSMLEQYHTGLICTSACLGGIIPSALASDDYDQARAAAERLKNLFGDDFYLEIQRHGIPAEQKVNPLLVRLSRELSIPLVATTDSHYLNKEDAKAHEVLLCIADDKTLSGPHRTFDGTGYHLQTSEEMEALFHDLPEALDNSLRIADKCSVEITLGEVNLPNYMIPDGFDSPLAYFRHLCEEGFQARFNGTAALTDPVYKERFEYEYDVIKSMHFESYFVIVQDFIQYARSIGVYIGPGRGSAAGSLLAYCMGITDMDPIRFGLLFERFLNPERVSWPDIDTDIAHNGRQKVIDYIIQKYGAESVCRIVTFGTMAAKMAIKDVARVMGLPASWSNALAKLVPKDPKITLDKALELNPELRQRYASEEDVHTVIDIAKALEGNKRHASQHACGVVIAPGPVSNFLPTSMELNKDTGEKDVTSQVIMTEVEELSLLKMDLLGLKNLSAIQEVINTIAVTRGIQTTYQALPLDDRDTYRMLAKGQTSAVFQLESPGMTRVITQMFNDIGTLPDSRMGECFERLIAAVALYRPGPMDFIPNYIAGMRDVHNVHYTTPELKPILQSTYGVIVFQEQVMQTVQALAGYSLGRADLVRKAMGKKKQAVMDAEKAVFIYGNKEAFESGKDKTYAPGCIANGIPEPIAAEIWGQMSEFAKYAFNRSHAACYAWLAFITAYMSCHWPEEFFCAMLNAFEDIGDKVKIYLSQASKRGISILPPDINKSMDKCTVENHCIRLGFHPLANLNKIGKAILSEREEHGAFKDYQDFFERMSDIGSRPSKKAMSSLIFSGCFDSFGLNKQQLFLMQEVLAKNYEKTASNRALGQLSFFAPEATKVPVPACLDYPDDKLMDAEYEAIGFYLSRHPVDGFSDFLKRNPGYTTLTDLVAANTPCQPIWTVGLIRDMRPVYTKKEQLMYTFRVEDRFTVVQCVIFPSRVEANQHLLQDGMAVKIVGEYTIDEDRGPQIIVQDLMSKEAGEKKPITSITVTIQDKRDQDLLLSYIQQHPGNIPVVLRALGRAYHIKQKVELTPEVLTWLKGNFVQVSI